MIIKPEVPCSLYSLTCHTVISRVLRPLYYSAEFYSYGKAVSKETYFFFISINHSPVKMAAPDDVPLLSYLMPGQ